MTTTITTKECHILEKMNMAPFRFMSGPGTRVVNRAQPIIFRLLGNFTPGNTLDGGKRCRLNALDRVSNYVNGDLLAIFTNRVGVETKQSDLGLDLHKVILRKSNPE